MTPLTPDDLREIGERFKKWDNGGSTIARSTCLVMKIPALLDEVDRLQTRLTKEYRDHITALESNQKDLDLLRGGVKTLKAEFEKWKARWGLA